MKKQRLIIVGSGGHGKVVLEAALLQNKYKIVGFADDTVKNKNNSKHEIIGTIKDLETGKIKADCFVVAIGNNNIRKKIFLKLIQKLDAAIIIHPSAVVSKTSELCKGTVILANSVISTNVSIGLNSVINSLCLVDHETVVGNHVHISQGTIIGSNVNLKDNYTSKLGERIKSFSIIK